VRHAHRRDVDAGDRDGLLLVERAQRPSGLKVPGSAFSESSKMYGNFRASESAVEADAYTVSGSARRAVKARRSSMPWM
jgi:hypothetical protein